MVSSTVTIVKLDDWIHRAEELIALADKTLGTQTPPDAWGTFVDEQLHAQLRSSGMAFLKNAFGENHPFYGEFIAGAKEVGKPSDVRNKRGVLVAAIDEMGGGWLRTARGLVSAEIFADFIDMADHLLSEGYQHAAAVMVGSVLEEHLRELARKASVATTTLKGGKDVPKSADTLNAELVKAGVYLLQDQKQVTAWLNLRNNAAHGQYGNYTADQVRLMLDGVRNFMARVPA